MNTFSEDYALHMDRLDPLKDMREYFFIDDEKLVYLDGNSLGRLPNQAALSVSNAVEQQWGKRLIRSWNEGWYDQSERLGNMIAPIAGASEGEIIISDSTSINLYKLAYAALKLQAGRTKIISDELNFPSDLYILQGLLKQFGPEYELEILRSSDGMTIDPAALAERVDSNTALVSLSHVVFKSAFRYPMKGVTDLVHAKGALMLWDLSHSIGAVPGELNSANADLAVGCTYKYLNGGPGSPAFLYVRKDLQEKLESPVWGWFGEKAPFEFGLAYRPASGIKKFLTGTPPVLSMTPLENSLQLVHQAGMEEIRKKSIQQSEYLIDLAATKLFPLGFALGSPQESERRGSHITLKHPEAYRICKALIDPMAGGFSVIPDFRMPDNIRLGISPLYTSFHDIYRSIIQLKNIVEENIFKNYSFDREEVT